VAEIRGVILNSVLTFLGTRFGKQAVDDAIITLSSQDRMLLRDVILDSTWYSYAALGTVRRLSAMLSRNASPALAIDMGKFNAEYVFTGVYKALLINDPVQLVHKFSWLHDFFYRDVFTLQTEIPSPGRCYLRYEYRDGVKPARSTCSSMMGFWIRTIELVGVMNVTARHTKCRAEGDDVCEYEMEWK
jgi:hypothetical protein